LDCLDQLDLLDSRGHLESVEQLVQLGSPDLSVLLDQQVLRVPLVLRVLLVLLGLPALLALLEELDLLDFRALQALLALKDYPVLPARMALQERQDCLVRLELAARAEGRAASALLEPLEPPVRVGQEEHREPLGPRDPAARLERRELLVLRGVQAALA